MQQEQTAIRLLIVEDFHAETEILLRELIDSELPHAFKVVSAESDFLLELVEFNPDVVLSPYSLKGTNAVKLLGLARELGSDVPFILLAFDLSEDIAIDLLAEGMEDYIQRGTVKRLPVAIRKALQRRRTMIELERTSKSLALAQNIAQIGSWELNPTDLSVWWSEEMFRIHGLEPQHITVELVRGLTHPDDLVLFEGGFNDIMSGIQTDFIYRLVMPEDGSIKHVRGIGRLLMSDAGTIERIFGTVQDVTAQVVEKERSEAALIQRDLTIKASKIGVWHWQINNNELFWDDRCYQIFGIPIRPLDPQDFVAMVHNEDRDRIQNLIGLALYDGKFNAEYRIIHPDGFRFIHAEATVTFNNRKVPVRMDGIILDLTDHYMLETTLKQREQLFRDMAESITEVFWLTDWELNKVLYVSPQYETLYGMSVHSLYEDSKSWVQNIHPDDVERVSRSFRENAAIGAYDEEYRLLLPDGSLKWVRDRAFPIFNPDGTVSRLAGITEEITQRKLDQDQLRSLSLVASETINGVLVHSPDGKVVWANKGFERITGYSPDEIIGKEPWELVASPDTNWKLVEMTYKKIQEGRPFTSDNVLRHKNGSTVWVNTAFAPVYNDKGELTTIVSIGTDITKQKELEELQRNMVGELEKRVSERTEQLNTINDELRNEIWEKQRLSDELYHRTLDMNDSLQYAKRIQESLLPQEDAIQRSFTDHFILFLPRDVVSGDLYWHHRKENLTFFSTIDCTGHGVPGALMSMIANELMNQAIVQRSMDDVEEILKFMNKLVVRTLKQKSGGAMRDGMDLSLIKIDHSTDILTFAGAFSNAYVVQNGELKTLNGSRFSIGGHLDEVKKSFPVHQVKLQKGDTVYLTTDGYIDQFGGPDGKKFMKKRFEDLIVNLENDALCGQKESLIQTLKDWMGSLHQVDDILVVGLRY